MADSSRSGAYPSSRAVNPALVIVAALFAAGIFAIDLLTPVWTDVTPLYVVPLLLSALSGPPRTALFGAWVTTLLSIADLFEQPWGGVPEVVFVNRAIAIIVIWTAAAIVIRFRETSLQLEERTRRLADLSYAIHESAIVALTDPRGRITFANDKFCEISGYAREELLGQDHRLINSGYHPREFMQGLWKTIAAGRVWRGEIRNKAKAGHFYWVDTTIVPFIDDRGRPYQYMAIRYDITDRKRSETLLREQEALTRLGQMAAVVAHEVKNPIAGIRGALQVILSRMAPDQRDRTIIGDIIARLDSLNAIVGDLLLYARPRQIRHEPIAIATLITSTADLIRRDPALAATTITVGGDTAATIQGDREMLQIVVQNVLINAAQAMGGRGRIEATIGAESGDVCRVAFADHGPGMPPEIKDKVFEAFFTTKHRGTGLGLPIARRVVEMHGGRISIDTPATGGTVVSIELPQG